MGCCAVAVVTVDANGSLAKDEVGEALVAHFRAANHRIVDRDLVQDDRAAIELLAEWIADLDTDVIVVSGVGEHALSVLLNCGRRVSGFGELARVAVFKELGSAAVHVRAEAVRTNDKLVIALAGTIEATRVVLDAIVLPQLSSADPAAVVALVPNSRARRFTLDRPSRTPGSPSLPATPRAEMTTDRLLVFGDLPAISHSVMVMAPVAKKRRSLGAIAAMCGVGVAAGLAFSIAHVRHVTPSSATQPEPPVVVVNSPPVLPAPQLQPTTPVVPETKAATAKPLTKATTKPVASTKTAAPAQGAKHLTEASPDAPPEAATDEEAKPASPPEMFDACTEETCAATNYERECCTPYKNSLAELPLVLDRTMVANAMADVMPAVNQCGDAGTGTVKLSIRVNPDGTASTIDVREATDEALGTCVVEAVRGAHFRATARGGAFTKTFTF